MSLAKRSIVAVSWNVGANLAKIIILLIRSIVLARLLPVEVFGIYALATSIVTFSAILPTFGMGSAFLHRAPETADEEPAAAVQFTLRLLLIGLWALVLILGSALLTNGPQRLALVVLTVVYGLLYLSDTPRFILTRRVQHKRLALLDLLAAATTTVVAIGMAWRGYGLTALLATDVVTLLLSVVVLYGWRPVWRPRLLWRPDTVRYYLRFGSRAMTGTALSEAIDNVDDIWVGAYLGQYALGLYSRAYTFATYPRRVLAFPVNQVAGGTYAELKEDRHRLSQAFFRTCALLVRSGFLMGGMLVLLAPEFVRLALGEKWLPMIPAFQLMAVFTLLDPLRVTVTQLFYAVGLPERVVRVRFVQLLALVAGLFLLGRQWDIVGVAVVVDVVLLIGLAPLLVMATAAVDFSARRLFTVPTLAVVAGAAAAWAAGQLACSQAACPNDWLTGAVKGAAFLLVYGGILLALERQEVGQMAGRVRRAIR